jgi:hypothetical protein
VDEAEEDCAAHAGAAKNASAGIDWNKSLLFIPAILEQ